MDQHHSATLTRTLSRIPSRRDVLRGLAGTALGLGTARWPHMAEAKKKRKGKRSKPKPKPNEYGCLDVGQACAGNDALCCSGICAGNKPRKGKRDTRRCAGHNAGVCTRDVCREGGVASCDADNPLCLCLGTTGKATFCGDMTNEGAACGVCQRDADCEPEFGAGAACVVLRGFCTGTCTETVDTACVSPCAGGPCVAVCAGRECGRDGCGGSCGTCAPPETCHNGACCLPDCNGKDCGDDGCGGSCGPCTGGACQDGVCACPEDKCGGACIAPCGGFPRNPFTCVCCLPSGYRPNPMCINGHSDVCCSGICGVFPTLEDGECIDKVAGQGCTFGAQCASNDCQDSGLGAGTCA